MPAQHSGWDRRNKQEGEKVGPQKQGESITHLLPPLVDEARLGPTLAYSVSGGGGSGGSSEQQCAHLIAPLLTAL